MDIGRMNKRLLLPKSILENLYCEEKLSINQCAKRLNVSYSVIRCRMKKYGIKARPEYNKGGHLSSETICKMTKSLKGKPKSEAHKENLRRYHTKIREELGITKKTLTELMIKRKMFCKAIGVIFSLSESTIARWAKKWGITPANYPEITKRKGQARGEGNKNRSEETVKKVAKVIAEQSRKRWAIPGYKEKVSIAISKAQVAHYDKVGRKPKAQIKIDNSIAKMMRMAIKEKKNGRHWEEFVDYTRLELMTHLERRFKPNMSWDNYGKGWHIDHIIPRSAFNYTDPSHIDFKRCWALDNLQPLWAKDNLSKKDKLTEPFQPSLAL